MSLLVPHNKGQVRTVRNKEAGRPLQKLHSGNDAVEREVPGHHQHHEREYRIFE